MSIFDDQNKNEPHLDEDKDYLAELTGPGGKYDRTKYPDESSMYKAIAKGKVHADRTLEHKLGEFDEIRETLIQKTAEANAAAKFEELFKKHVEGRTNIQQTPKPDDVEQPQFDPSQVQELIDQRLREKDARDQETRNLNEVEKLVKEKFGDNADRVFKERMKFLGLTAEDVKFLAKKSPTVLLNSMGFNQQQAETYEATPASSQRSDNFRPNSENKRAASYWDKLKKTDPKKYFSPESSTQRMKDIDDLGSDFDDMSRRSSRL